MEKYLRKLKRLLKNSILILLFIISFIILISEINIINIYIISSKIISIIYIYLFIKANTIIKSDYKYIIYTEKQKEDLKRI